MALFKWQCKSCFAVTKDFLSKRPELGPCPVCQGKLMFLTSVTSQTMEVIDNGLMGKIVERPVDIVEKISERNSLAEKPDDPVI